MSGRAKLLGFGIRRLHVPGGRRRALNVALIGTIALLVLVLAAFTEPTDETPQVRLSSGSAWLVSPTVAAVTLVDGASESIVAARRLEAEPDDEVSVTQSGTDAFVVNDTRGTVARIDGSTLQVQPGRQFADSPGSLELVAGPSALWVLDANRGQAFRVDPRSLATQFEASLAARPGSSQSIVDADGRLWVIDSDRGGLIWIDGIKRHEADEPPGTGSRLVLVRDRPVLADPTSGQLRSIDSDGDIGEPTCLDIQDGADAQLFGSRDDHIVYAAVSQTGTLLTAATDTDDCSKAPLTISNRGDVLGPPVSSDRFLFVPNLTTGSTIIVDTRNRTVLPPIELVDDGHDFELIAKDGLVFYNDLDGSRAGVLSYDSTGWRVGQSLQKFDAESGEITALDDDTSSASPPTDAPGPADSPAGADNTSDPDQPDFATRTSSQPTGGAAPTTTRSQPPTARPPLPNPEPAPPRPVEPDPGPNNPAATVRLTLAVSGDGSVTGPNGLSCPGTCSATVPGGSLVSLTATLPNRRVATWSGPCAGQTTSCAFSATVDTSIGVTISSPPRTNTVTATVDGPGSISTSWPDGTADCPPVCTASVDAGDTITLTAVPDESATFIGWTGACQGQGTQCQLTPVGDATAGAQFSGPMNAVDVFWTDGSNGGHVEVIHNGQSFPCDRPRCHYDFPRGDIVTLHPVAQDGWVFTGWAGVSGSCLNEDCVFAAGSDPDGPNGDALASANFVHMGVDTGAVDLRNPTTNVFNILVDGPNLGSLGWRATSNADDISVEPSGTFAGGMGTVHLTDTGGISDGIFPEAINFEIISPFSGFVYFSGTVDAVTNAKPTLRNPGCARGTADWQVTVDVLDANLTLVEGDIGSGFQQMSSVGGNTWALTIPLTAAPPGLLSGTFRATDRYAAVGTTSGQVVCN